MGARESIEAMSRDDIADIWRREFAANRDLVAAVMTAADAPYHVMVDVLDELFSVLVRDFSAFAVELHGKDSATVDQQRWALGAVRRPVVDEARSERVWERVEALSGSYEMAP